MLGWEIFIEEKAPGAVSSQEERPTIATWRTSLGGTQWLDDLVARGLARDLGGDGYPCRYEVSARVLTAALSGGVPRPTGPPVFGDNYVLPAGYVGDASVDMPRLQALGPEDLLIVEAWDLS